MFIEQHHYLDEGCVAEVVAHRVRGVSRVRGLQLSTYCFILALIHTNYVLNNENGFLTLMRVV